MRILVNTRLLLKDRLEGIGWFTYETLRRITIQNPEVEFLFLFDRKYHHDFIFSKNVTPIVAGPPTRHPFLIAYWFEFVVPRIIKKYQPDCFLSTDGFISLRANIPTLQVIHDINFEHFEGIMPKTYEFYYQYFFHRMAKKANRITTVSKYSKNDLMETYSIDENKIDVAYNGVNELYKPLGQKINLETANEFSHGAPYFLFIGSLNPRKNLLRLLLAFDRFKKESNSNLNLLIVGEKMWGSKQLMNVYHSLEFKENVKFLGNIEPITLSKLLSAAKALCYVSLFEGFGIPILEGFASGTPVITSDVSSMPEVAGDAAILVNPISEIEISTALNKIYEDKIFAQELIEKGLVRVKHFSWDKTAKILWDSVEKLAHA